MTFRHAFLLGMLVLGAGCRNSQFSRWALVWSPTINARMGRPASDPEGLALRVHFEKKSRERRLLAFEKDFPDGLPESRALEILYSLHLPAGSQPRLAVILLDGKGNSWLRVKVLPVSGRETLGQFRIPLTQLRPAAYNADPQTEMKWSAIRKARVGLALDGEVAGEFVVEKIEFTSEPFRPAGPLNIESEQQAPWPITRDKATSASLAIVPEGPQPGKENCVRFEFTFPLHRHMFAFPVLSLNECDLEGYGALEFAYRAKLPKGINGLLVQLIERDGSVYCALPAPPASPSWKTLRIPFAQFKLGSWTKDENGRLDPAQVRKMSIGAHGVAVGDGGKGMIHFTGIKFRPAKVKQDQ